jgi:hypothetical protein
MKHQRKRQKQQESDLLILFGSVCALDKSSIQSFCMPSIGNFASNNGEAEMKIRKPMLVALLLLVTSVLPVTAQDRDRDRDRHDDRDNQRFYNGVRDGGRGGEYYNPRHDRPYDGRYDRYNNGYYSNQGGIGPGKGALIGGAGGAALGALFGHGLKGTLIGGAAGAGIGAVVGEEHQKNERNQYYPR